MSAFRAVSSEIGGLLIFPLFSKFGGFDGFGLCDTLRDCARCIGTGGLIVKLEFASFICATLISRSSSSFEFNVFTSEKASGQSEIIQKQFDFR